MAFTLGIVVGIALTMTGVAIFVFWPERKPLQQPMPEWQAAALREIRSHAV